jgi:predicted small secreted protein
MKKLLSLLTVLAFLAIPLAGCNTMEGFGKDVQKVGDEIEDEADK